MPDLTFTSRDDISPTIDRINDKMQEQKLQIQANAAEGRRLDKISQDIMRRQETAQERYNRMLKDTQDALRRTGQSQETVRKATTKLADEYKSLTGRFKDFNQEQKKSTGSDMIGGVLKLASGYLTMQTALQAITAELRSQQELRDKATQGQLSIGQSRADVIRNMPATADADIKQVLKQNQDLARALNIKEEIINASRSQTLSATGGDVGKSLEATRIAAQYLKDTPDAIAEFSGTMADLARATGSTKGEVNLGFLATIGGVSRIVDPRAQAMNIPKAIIGGVNLKATAEESAAMFSALTVNAADVTGAPSSTANIALVQQVMRSKLVQGTFQERIRQFQKNPELAKAFFAPKAKGTRNEGASFEKQFIGPIRELLMNPSSQMAKDFEANLTKFSGGTAAWEKEGLDTIRRLSDVNELGAVDERVRGAQSAVDQMRVLAGKTALSSDELTNLKEVLKRTGDGSGVGWRILAGAGTEVTREEAADLLEQRRKLLVEGGQDWLLGGDAANRIGRMSTEKRLESAKILEDLIRTYREGSDDTASKLDDQTEVLKQIRDGVREGGGLVGGGE